MAFAAASLGGSMLGFDDHPGQLDRLWHVMNYGPAPWAWTAAGGRLSGAAVLSARVAYLGALLAWPTTGVLDVRTVYQMLLWLAYLLPGVTTYIALARLTGLRWLAVAGAFVALTLSAGLASGVDGGVRTGMVGARLAWALLPLLLWLLARWAEGERPLSLVVPPLLAAVTLLHPAQLPAAVLLLGWPGARAPWRRRAFETLRALALAAALTAFWTLPLLLRLRRRARWRGGTLRSEVTRPLPIVLAGLAVAGLLDRARRERRRAPGALVAPRDGRGDRARSPGGRAARHPLAAGGSHRSTAPGSRSSSPAVSGAARLARRLDAMPITQRLASRRAARCSGSAPPPCSRCSR